MLACPFCSHIVSGAEKYLGKTGRCPKCRGAYRFPASVDGSTVPVKPPPAVPVGATSTPATSADVVERHQKTIVAFDFKDLFFGAAIPRDKLLRAMASYATNCRLEAGERPLMLWDGTVFGSAKNGLLLTDRAIYAKELWCAPVTGTLDELRHVRHDGRVLYLADNRLVALLNFPDDLMEAVTRMLLEIGGLAAAWQSGSAPKPPCGESVQVSSAQDSAGIPPAREPCTGIRGQREHVTPPVDMPAILASTAQTAPGPQAPTARVLPSGGAVQPAPQAVGSSPSGSLQGASESSSPGSPTAGTGVPQGGTGTDEVEALIEEGKKRGFLTYEEVNKVLPDDMVAPDKVDQILTTLDELGIDLVDGDGTVSAQPHSEPTPIASASPGSGVTSGRAGIEETLAPITLSGHGEGATTRFDLAGGIAIFKMRHDGDGYWAPRLLSTTGQGAELLAKVLGPFEGSRVLGVDHGAYLINVKANGAWNITVEQPRPGDADGLPQFLSGHTHSAEGPFRLDAGIVHFAMKHLGDKKFLAALLDGAGNYLAYLTSPGNGCYRENADGSVSKGRAIPISCSGLYWIDIEASGDWSMEVTRDEIGIWEREVEACLQRGCPPVFPGSSPMGVKTSERSSQRLGDPLYDARKANEVRRAMLVWDDAIGMVRRGHDARPICFGNCPKCNARVYRVGPSGIKYKCPGCGQRSTSEEMVCRLYERLLWEHLLGHELSPSDCFARKLLDKDGKLPVAPRPDRDAPPLRRPAPPQTSASSPTISATNVAGFVAGYGLYRFIKSLFSSK